MDAFIAGEWQISPSLNRMSRGGQEVRLEPKVMQVLECLAATPGEVVSRDDLVARVWPGVFVTDDVLHRAVRELRRAFEDETAKPAYVETIRKRGYRLIAPVRPLDAKPLEPVVLPPPPPTSVRFVALTSSPLNESDRAVSADGARLAFAMRPKGSEGPADIYLATGAGHTPERLIAHPADDRYPAWSPDSATLAFIRIDGTTGDIMLMALAERRERRLAACGNLEEPRVSWSANGEWLVESFAPGPDPIRGWQIARISTRSGTRELLTLPVPATLGDYSPAVSPDGSRIAFVRGINGATADIFTIPFNGGAATRVTWDNDGSSVIFGARVAGVWQLIRLDLVSGTRTQLTTTNGYAGQESPDGASILFTRLEEPGVWTLPTAGGTPRLLVPAVRAAEYANFRVTTSGIYYVGVTADQGVVRKAPPTGGAGEDVARLGNYSWPGFAVTAESSVRHAHWDRRESNIMAVETK